MGEAPSEDIFLWRVPDEWMKREKPVFHIRQFLDFFYPGRCPVCGRILAKEESLVCRRCRAELPWVKEPVCVRCGKPIASPLCADCERTDHAFTEGRAALLYEKGVRLSVNRMKFYNHREYLPFYAACMYAAHRGHLQKWNAACIIPVPMHPKKRAERGFDQAVLLARALSGLCRIPVLENVLIRTRYTKASRKLGREHRLANLRGAFTVRQREIAAAVRSPGGRYLHDGDDDGSCVCRAEKSRCHTDLFSDALYRKRGGVTRQINNS